MTNPVFVIVLIISFSYQFNQANAYSSRFFEGGVEHEFDCSFKFKSPKSIDCACISGLWSLRESQCTEPLVIGGDTQFCFSLANKTVSYAEQLLTDKRDLTVQRDDLVIPIKSLSTPFELLPQDSLIAGMEWTLTDNAGNSICLFTLPNSYCFFKAEDLGITKLSSAFKGCRDEIAFTVLPVNCVPNNPENKNVCYHHLRKREASNSTSRSKGRLFLGAPGQNLSIYDQTVDKAATNTITNFDEDFLNSPNDTDSTMIVRANDAIASEIYNFIEAKLDVILGLSLKVLNQTQKTDKKESDKKGKPSAVKSGSVKRPKRAVNRPRTRTVGKGRTIGSAQAAATSAQTTTVAPAKEPLKSSKSPVYQFLELSKKVMQKSCPDFYVRPEYFDLAVSAFIKIQKKHFKFPEGATNYHGYWRILESLQDCIGNMTTLNFTQNHCDSRDKPVGGMFCDLDTCVELNVRDDFSTFDPIIETVWSIFKTTHAACFPYFNKNYNDHHRFTMWTIPLFQNQINDVWRASGSRGIVYGGFFGNLDNNQAAVAYCSTGQQLRSKYPWELPRPDKAEELVTGSYRRKRELQDQSQQEEINSVTSGECMTSDNIPKCEFTL